MIWFVSTLLSMIILTYTLWLVLQGALNELLNLTGNTQRLINKINEGALDLSMIIPGVAQRIEKLGGVTNELMTEIRKGLNSWTDKIQKLIDKIIIAMPIGMVLFLLSIILKLQWLAIFLSVLFLISGFLFLEIYSPILDAITHKRFRRSTRPLGLINAYFFNLLIVCAYWYFVDYNTFIIALTALSIWMIILMGFGFAGHYFLEKRNDDDNEGWYARESNAAGKALRFSAVAFIVVLALIKFTETTAGSALAGTIKATSKVALKKVNIFQGKIAGLPGYATKKTKLYILIKQSGKKKLVPLQVIPVNTTIIFPDSLATTITGSRNGKKITLVKAIVNGENGFIPEKDIQIGYPPPSTPTKKVARTHTIPSTHTSPSTIKKQKNNLFLSQPTKIEWNKNYPLTTPFLIPLNQEYVIRTLSGKPFYIKILKNGKEEWSKETSGTKFQCIDYPDVVMLKKTIPGKETFVFIPIS